MRCCCLFLNFHSISFKIPKLNETVQISVHQPMRKEYILQFQRTAGPDTLTSAAGKGQSD